MNASRLREIVDLLLDIEAQFQIQGRLNDANSALGNIISQPQQPQFQTQFSAAVEQLRSSSAQIQERLQPTQIALIEEIGGESFFVVDLAGEIDEWLQKNVVTPAVTQQNLQKLLEKRQHYIEQITRLRTLSKRLGSKPRL